MKAQACACGSDQSYSACCQPMHRGVKKAKSAELLMRSRYAAYALCECQYLIDSHHPDTRGTLSVVELEKSNAQTTWLGLEILSSEENLVSFRAYFVQRSKETQQRLQCLHEESRFVKEGDNWFYIDGQHKPELAALPRRKDPCFCGSGKKFKNCHGNLID